jgi:hypothetical protein
MPSYGMCCKTKQFKAEYNYVKSQNKKRHKPNNTRIEISNARLKQKTFHSPETLYAIGCDLRPSSIILCNSDYSPLHTYRVSPRDTDFSSFQIWSCYRTTTRTPGLWKLCYTILYQLTVFTSGLSAASWPSAVATTWTTQTSFCLQVQYFARDLRIQRPNHQADHLPSYSSVAEIRAGLHITSPAPAPNYMAQFLNATKTLQETDEVWLWKWLSFGLLHRVV